jgi:hypothetical protein
VADLRRHDSVRYPRRRFEFLGRADPSRVTADDVVALTLVASRSRRGWRSNCGRAR